MLFKLGLQYPDRLPPVVRAELEQLIAAIQQQSTNEIPVINIPMGSLIVTPDQIHGGSPGSVLLGLDSGRFLSTYLTAGPGIGLAPASGALTISALGGGSGGGPGIPGRDGEDAECFIIPGPSGGGGGTPGMGGAMTKLAQVVCAGSQTTVSFPSIPAGYDDLLITYLCRATGVVGEVGANIQFNGDATAANYTGQYDAGFSGVTAAGATGGTTAGLQVFTLTGTQNSANATASGAIRIPGYLSTVLRKSVTSEFVDYGRATQITGIWQMGGVWASAAAITSALITISSDSFLNGSIFTLWALGPNTGSVGATGATGAIGPVGPMGLVVPGLDGDDASCYCVGERGPQGEPGASTSVLAYRAETTSTAANDPGAGLMRWNDATQSAATALYIDRLTENKFDATAVLATIGQQDQFIVQDRDIAAAYQVWTQTGPAINHSDWFEVPVSFVSSSGQAQFTNQQRLSILLKTAGVIAPHQTSHQVGGSDELVNAAWTNQPNVFTEDQTISSSSGYPGLVFNEAGQPTGGKNWRITSAAQSLYFQPANDAGLGISSACVLNRLGDMTVSRTLGVGSDIYEKSRTTPMGHWIDVPFNPANFPNVSGATASVNHYMLVGNTLTWQLYLSGQIVAQTTDLLMTCPVNHLQMYMSGGCGHSYYNGSFGGAIGSSLQWITNPSDPTLMMVRNAQYLAGINPGLFEVMFTAVYRIA